MENRFIAVEGVMGVGKTTITEKIAEHFGYQPLFEIVDENPFLKQFYEDPEHWSFQTEVFFLCNRYKQLQKVMEWSEENKNIVADYHIIKNSIFSRLTLNDEDFIKYKKLFDVMIEGFRMPDVIIYYRADLEEILRRIKKRGRDMEKNLDPGYIEDLIKQYDDELIFENINSKWPETSLIVIDGNEIDFLKDPSKYNKLYKAIEDSQHIKNIKIDN